MPKEKRLPIGRAAQLLAQPLGTVGGRIWLTDQLRDGALVARCATWTARSNWALADHPAAATDYELPSFYWNLDRTHDGERVADNSAGKDVSRIAVNSDWTASRFSDVRTIGSVSATARAVTTTMIAAGITIEEAAFARLTIGIGIDAKAPVEQSASPPIPAAPPARQSARGPEPTYDRHRALAYLIARANDHKNDGGLNINPLFGKRGDQAKIERLLEQHFLDLGEEPAASIIRAIAQIAMDGIAEHRHRRLLQENPDQP